jgi:putative phosphoesterase
LIQLAAIISDTHLPRGQRRLPDACLTYLREADVIVHAGDFSSVVVLEQLRALGPPVVAVHGNVDEAALKETLPDRLKVMIGGARIGLVHDAGPGPGRLERLRAGFPDCVAVIFGHSHIPLHEQRDSFQIFNPGSPTDRRRQPERTMGLLRLDDGAVDFELIALGI